MRIVLLHDLFRSQVFGLGGLNRVAGFWHAMLGPKLAALGHGLTLPEPFRPDRAPVLEEFAARHGLAMDQTSWVRLYSDPAWVPAIAELIAPWRNHDLALGWELSPNMVAAIGQLGLKVIDTSIDAVRFCPDLFFRLRASDPRHAERLAEIAVPDDVPLAEAARRIAAWDGAAAPDAMLFAGQMPLDASLVVGAQVIEAAGFAAALAIGAAGRRILLKPHPHAQPWDGIRALHTALPDSHIVMDPVYDLLAAPWLREVATLSSSVAEEAVFFGKTARRLIMPDAAAGLSPHSRIDATFLTKNFWDRLLSRRPPPRQAEPPARTLRSLFSYDWGWRPVPAKACPVLGVGDRLRFADGAAIPGFGWSQPEDWGVWSDGDVATLRLRLAPEVRRLRLHAMGFVPDPAMPPSMRASFRPGGPSRMIVLATGPADHDIPVPPAARGAWVELVLRFDDLASPESAGHSTDARRIGLGLIALTGMD